MNPTHLLGFAAIQFLNAAFHFWLFAAQPYAQGADRSLLNVIHLSVWAIAVASCIALFRDMRRARRNAPALQAQVAVDPQIQLDNLRQHLKDGTITLEEYVHHRDQILARL